MTPTSKNKVGTGWKKPPIKFLTKIVVLLLLVIPLAIAAVPGYLQGGEWLWSDLPTLSNRGQMKSLLETGITFPEWETTVQKQIRIGGKNWSAQAITAQSKPSPVIILLAPQTYYTNKPYVEWTDLQGLEKWKTDSYRQLEFMTKTTAGANKVTARFFRAWNTQTFAVVQWYAFPNGGHPSSSNWFWRDQVAQLKGQRIPWVAVCLKIPLNPLDDLEEVETLAVSLSQHIQNSLQENTFNVSAQQTN